MIEINGKKTNFTDADWKVCIILDACRYDIFRDVYKDIIKDGTLKKTYTNCSGTFEWMQDNFKDEDCSDIIYINPIVMFDKFMPNSTFYKVVNVWEYGWNYTYGTILPSEMTKTALEVMAKYPEKRFIIHYHQPHPPYLHPDFIGIEGPVDTPEEILKMKEKKFNILQCIQGNIRKLIGSNCAWNLLTRLGITPTDYYGKIYKRYGKERIVSGYIETLRLTLEEITKIIENTRGKVVITSDHSKNFDGGQKDIEKQPVPWMEIDNL